MTQMIDINRAAELSGMSVAWWRQKVFRRAVPFHRVGRRILVNVEDIEDMLSRCRVEPCAESALRHRTPPTQTGGLRRTSVIPKVCHADR